MLIFFRWWGALVVLALPLAIGTIWGFGLSSFFVKSLCSSTAFLGSIVVGNGINCGIILMARYTDERQAGKNPIDAIKVAIRGTWMGTLAATFAASAGYASLLTTTFRGFNEFAIIGSVGMLACWLATYFLLPPLLRLLDRRRQIQVIGTRGLTSPGSWLENAVIKKSRTILMISVLLLLASLTALTRFNDSYIEYNMSNLRNRHSAINGEGYWSRQMDQVTGRNFTAVALMANSEADARVIGAQLRQQARVPPLSAITSRIVTSEDVLPPDQEQRQGEVQKIVQLLNTVILSALSEADRATMDSFIKAAKAPVIVPADLPELLVLGLREKDGQFGRTALLLQSLDGSTWNGVLTIQAAAKLRDIAVKVTPPADIAGGFFVSANVLEVLDRVALPTTLTAFIAVCLIVLILFRARRHAFWVLFSLLMGVSFMACAVIVFNLRINFINFMAFPITFGIGVEYAVNVLQRYRENPVDMTAIVGKTGSAVALCSLTTILGYGSLLVASNQALFSFGVLAVIGEITCLLTAILILPALLATLNKPVKA
jgi:predicted RND superfamily exporter protein